LRRNAVLIVRHGVDDHASLVSAELEKLGVEVVCLDTDRFPHATSLTFSVEAGVPSIQLRVDERQYRGDMFAAVWYRHIRLPLAPYIADHDARRMAESELRWTLEGALLALEPVLWANHPHANLLARSKLLQLRIAARLGFKIPETHVTADPRAIRDRYRTWGGRMVAKLAGGQIVAHSIDTQFLVPTTLVTQHDLQDEAALCACPAIYQRLVEKLHDLRVTVVGDEVFACRIDSPAHEKARVDWRAAGEAALDLQPCGLDTAIADRCRALLRTLGLEIAGIDFIVTPDGDTVFLEINAAGQWAWVQEATGLPIAASIARRLYGACGGAFVRTRPL
jgi:glutathione synthase/RimK-type ligase-like ATP-grasp enzyme